jgi:hypothetical protein
MVFLRNGTGRQTGLEPINAVAALRGDGDL